VSGPSIAFDRAAGFYDQSRGLPPEVEELVADLDAPHPAGHRFTLTAVRF
jgi:hypothetical protein